ncbi:MAG: hypothetical protein AABZ32_05170 [Bacteroidota bacterium]
MANTIEKILRSDKKPKEKISLLTKNIKQTPKLIDELMDYFEVGTNAEKGSCFEVLKYVSESNPEIVLPYLDIVIELINDKEPKIRWQTARVVGNMAKKFPNKASNAVSNLLTNTKDKGTVVRWCAAFALTEIAKNNPKLQKELLPKINTLIKTEQNNGVKNVYIKTLKTIEKKS